MKRPGRTLTLAACCILLLAIAGLNAEARLHQTSLSIGGSESAKTATWLKRYFGDSEPFVILLRGPRRALARQGKDLVRSLERNPRATTISPWDRGTVAQLRPTGRKAVIFVTFRVDLDHAVKNTVPYLNGLLRQQIKAPVRAVQSGYASVSRAIQAEAARATERGELIAVPLVLIVLLLVFRSPIAAAIPLVFGGATVAAARGLLSIAAGWLSIDAFALTVSAMMGLALGVDYTLLMVSRFREEMASGASPRTAAKVTQGTAGRTIAFAGGALFLSMGVSALLLPGTFLVSLAGAVVVVAGLSVLLGFVVVPPLLAVLGENIDRWSLPRSRGAGFGVLRLVNPVLRRPAAAAALITVGLICIAMPAISLRVGPPNPDQLPEGNHARQNAELVNREIGPGWAAPYVVLAATRRGPITSPAKVQLLKSWESRVKALPGVAAVVGPGPIARRVEPIRRSGTALLAQGRPGSQAAELEHLGARLGTASGGVRRLRGGIGEATDGAGLIVTGSANVHDGTRLIEAGLHQAATGGHHLSEGVSRFASGARAVRKGQRHANLGALALRFAIEDLLPRLRHSTLIPSRRLQRELTQMHTETSEIEHLGGDAAGMLDNAIREIEASPSATTDPHLGAALDALEVARTDINGPAPDSTALSEVHALGVRLDRATELTELIVSGSAGRLEEGREAELLAGHLVEGLTRLEGAGSRLSSGAQRLLAPSSLLASGLSSGTNEAAKLANGAERLASGATSLQQHLGEAYVGSRPLAPGLTEAAAGSTAEARRLRRKSRRLRTGSPGLFRSGYLTLSALDGAPADVRSQVGQTVDVERGGQAARILVIPKHEASSALDGRLRAAADRLGAELRGPAGVAGGPAELHDYSAASRSRLPLVIAAVSLVTFLILVYLLRAVLAALVTVLLNLLSVAVAFGVLALVSHFPSGAPIGHWGYIDTIGAVAIFAIAFGVSVDYSVFILARIREAFDRDGDPEKAVREGVKHTGRIITGAALMMVAVFAAFASSSLAIVSQLGTGLTVAILVDATLIRLVLLPALLLLLGERAWWIPARFSRLTGEQGTT
jgi:putative drug exporter of the RND superfamily